MLRLHSYLFTYFLHGAESFLLSWPVLIYSRNSSYFMETEGSLPHSLVLKLHSVGKSLLSREHWWNDPDGKTRSTRSKTCPSAAFSTTNPTQTGLGSYLGLCCAADGVGHGTIQTPPQLRRMCFLPKYQSRSLLFDL